MRKYSISTGNETFAHLYPGWNRTFFLNYSEWSKTVEKELNLTNSKFLYQCTHPLRPAVYAKCVPRKSLFISSTILLVLPFVLEGILIFSRESAEFYLSRLTCSCCPRRAGKKALRLAVPLAMLLQLLGIVKLWAFVAKERLKWTQLLKTKRYIARESQQQNINQNENEVGRPSCLLWKTEKITEQVEKNAEYIETKSRFITTSVESSCLPLLLIFSEFPNFLEDSNTLDFSSLRSFMQSAYANNGLILTFLTISSSIFTLALQESRYYFSRKSWQESKNLHMAMPIYFLIALVEATVNIVIIMEFTVIMITYYPRILKAYLPPPLITVIFILLWNVFLTAFFLSSPGLQWKGKKIRKLVDTLTIAFGSIIFQRAPSFREGYNLHIASN